MTDSDLLELITEGVNKYTESTYCTLLRPVVLSEIDIDSLGKVEVLVHIVGALGIPPGDVAVSNEAMDQLDAVTTVGELADYVRTNLST